MFHVCFVRHHSLIKIFSISDRMIICFTLGRVLCSILFLYSARLYWLFSCVKTIKVRLGIEPVLLIEQGCFRILRWNLRALFPKSTEVCKLLTTYYVNHVDLFEYSHCSVIFYRIHKSFVWLRTTLGYCICKTI